MNRRPIPQGRQADTYRDSPDSYEPSDPYRADMLSEPTTASFPDTAQGRHAAWLWNAITDSGSEVDEAQLSDRLSPDARSFSYFRDASRLRSFAENLTIGATLHELRVDSPKEIVGRFTTAAGLELELAIV